MLCPICKTEFTPKVHNAKFCSNKCKCKSLYIKQRDNPKNICVYCGKLTSNPKFCSSKCSGLSHNKAKGYFCKTCGIKLSDTWTSIVECKNCKTIRKNNSDTNLTLEQLKIKMPNINQFHAKIRGLARIRYKSSGKCIQCGYDKHTHVCHIKPIKDFDKSATLNEVNDLSNLTELCPNCHWELDNKQK